MAEVGMIHFSRMPDGRCFMEVSIPLAARGPVMRACLDCLEFCEQRWSEIPEWRAADREELANRMSAVVSLLRAEMRKVM